MEYRPHTDPTQQPNPEPPAQRVRLRKKPLLLVSFGAVLVAVLLLILFQPKGIRIALDAGHGGDDPGAIGLQRESDLTEVTIGYLEEFLTEDENYYPILCREYGRGEGINQRCARARRQGAKLLLSVHANYSEDADAHGFECYPAPPNRDIHEDSLRFAGEIVREISGLGLTIRGAEGIRYAYYDEAGTKLIVEATDPTNYDYPSFGIVENSGCPAVLVEQGFVTNSGDMDAVGTRSGCKLAAARYYRAICAYFNTEPVFDENGRAILK